MPDYVSLSACKGRRPRRSDAPKIHSRPNLVNRLMRERSVARFIVAPDGFGKSEIALEYADVIFSFKHTFWFDSRSPCFLRDLDRGNYAETILGIDPSVQLVVFDDVPRLDADRADALSGAIDALLSSGCEVVVTVSPSCDAFGRRQADRIFLGANDMLLTDAEVDDARSPDERARRPASSVRAAERVPVVAWGGSGCLDRLVKGIVAEDLPADVLSVIFEMLVLVDGRADEASLGQGAARLRSLGAASFSASYPYLGIDGEGERFDAAEVPVEAIAKAFSSRLSSIAEELLVDTADDLVARLADGLLGKGRADRACGLVGAASSRAARESWLAARGFELTECGCLVPACALYASARPSGSAGGGILRVGEAVRRCALGDEEEALDLATRTALSASSSSEARCLAAVMSLRIGSASGIAFDRRGVVRALAEALGAPEARGEGWSARILSQLPGIERGGWWPLGAVALSLEDGAASGASTWRDMRDAGAPGFSLAASGAIVVEDAARECAEGNPHDADVADVVSFIAAYAERDVAGAGYAGLLSVACLRALDEARERMPRRSLPEPTDATRQAAQSTWELVAAQRGEHLARKRAARESARAAFAPRARRSSRSSLSRAAAANLPVLRVDLFGGLTARIGGVIVDSPLLRRKKVGTLIALLALDAGREMPRDALIDELWPESSIDAARKNLYTLWSLARRALSLPDGTCPYLVRMQNGYKMDDRAFESDVRRVDEITRTLAAGRPDARSWTEMLGELESLCAADLMPCEPVSSAIARRRFEYRVRIVDALVAAARRLAREGEAQTALWFARAAYDRDQAREDVFAALMHAQIAAGQRTSALETYFECRRFLAEGLGIDPSADVVALYRSIIEETAIVNW